VADRAGKFEQAHGGTLFLDEVGDMSLAAQAKVLRALEQGVVTRVGSSRSIEVDVRVVAATNKDLETEIKEGRFREDLYYRLNVVPIEIPPLRDRREDIPMLVHHFVDLLEVNDRVTPREIAPEAMERLQSLDWPGNVRELRNTVERLLILSSGDTIGTEDVDFLVSGGDGGGGLSADLMQAESFSAFKEMAEKAFLLQKLREHDWNVSETARSVDMPRSNLYKKIDRYGLVRED
jgi:two-component system nitrogen regulation response regulator NtrX